MLNYAGRDFFQTELDELSLIVNYKGDNLIEFVNNRLLDKSTNTFNDDLVFMYLKFHSCGLVKGEQIVYGFEFQGLTYRAKDLLDDIKYTQTAQIKAIKSDRRFQLFVMLLGGIGGLIFTAIGNLITKFFQ